MKPISEAVLRLSQSHSLNEIIGITRDSGRQLTGADGIAFILREGDFVFIADENAIEPLWKGRRFPISTSVSGWTMTNRETAVIEDIFSDPRVPLNEYTPTFIKSAAVVPILQQEPVGAIGAYWASKHRATTDEMMLLQTLANCAGIAMKNAELIGDLRETKSSLETSLRSRDEFLSIAAHELRTPVTALKLQLQITELELRTRMISDSHFGNYQEASDRSLRQVMNLETLVEQLLDVSRIRLEMLDLEYAHLNFSELVKRGLEQLGHSLNLARCPVQTILPDSVMGEWDRGRILQIVTNLLSNVCKYAPNNPVHIMVTPSVDIVQLSIKDHGPGIPKELQTKIFDRFARGSKSSNVGGLGLGLFITRELVELHGGHIFVENNKDRGANFVIQLPIRRPHKMVSLNC